MTLSSKIYPDFNVFFQDAIAHPRGKYDLLPMLGIDECLNQEEIHSLCMSLLNQELIVGKTDLWSQARVKSNGATLNVQGGIGKNNKVHFESALDDIGVPKIGYSFPDVEIIEHSLAYLTLYPTFVLLSENTAGGQDGLKTLLNALVKDQISSCHNSKLRYVVIFKKGKTKIDDYCKEVANLVARNEFPFGYSEYRV